MPEPPSSRSAQATRAEPRWESRHERREARRERKAESHEEEAARSAHGRGFPSRFPLPPVLVGIVILVALRVASVATTAVFRLFLPMLFAILAIFLGQHMRKQGQRMAEVGRAGNAGLRRATAAIREHFFDELDADEHHSRRRRASEGWPAEPSRPSRTRVAAEPKVVDIDVDADETDLEADEPRRSRSGR